MATITKKDLQHIPGDWGLPFFGHFFEFVANATKFYETQKKNTAIFLKLAHHLAWRWSCLGQQLINLS